MGTAFPNGGDRGDSGRRASARPVHVPAIRRDRARVPDRRHLSGDETGRADGCLRDDADDIFANAYQWIAGEMLRAGILPKQEKALTVNITPIWAYARWTDNHHRPRVKPDRRYYAFRSADFLSHHLIHLRIPVWRVMLSDMDDWHAVLNH